MYNVSTGEARQLWATGADCCGYENWSDLAWTASGDFGLVVVDLGEFGDDPSPSFIFLDGFTSRDNDQSFAPSPSGNRVVLTHDGVGRPRLVVARADGTHRRLLTTGYQPDWQPRPVDLSGAVCSTPLAPRAPLFITFRAAS